jgi:FkbM family methyltransferase
LSISKDAKVFVDVGANVGFYSIAVALVSPTCSVHAFEPNPGLWNKLGQNLDLNQVEPRVRLHKYGLDTKTGELDFFIPAETGTGGGSLRNLHPEEGSPEVKTVKVMPFSEVPNKPEPDLVKIDVEGNEKAVVESMLTSISANHPSIIIELLRKWMAPFGNHPMDVATVLLKLGYHMFAISNLGLTEVSFIDESTDESTDETNFLFVHPSREKHLTIAQDYLQKPKVM